MNKNSLFTLALYLLVLPILTYFIFDSFWDWLRMMGGLIVIFAFWAILTKIGWAYYFAWLLSLGLLIFGIYFSFKERNIEHFFQALAIFFSGALLANSIKNTRNK